MEFYFARYVVNFGIDSRSSCHTDNRKKSVLILGKGMTEGINDGPGAAEKKFGIDFS